MNIEKCPFKIGQHVKFTPPHKGFHDLYLLSEKTGLSPRMIYEIENILPGGELVLNTGMPTHWKLFKNGELEFKLGKIDDSWDEEKRRQLARKKNFEDAGLASKRYGPSSRGK